MARWAGEMEFEFIEGADDGGGSFVATAKVVQFLRNHLARGEVDHAARLYEDTGAAVAPELVTEARSASSTFQKALAEMFVKARDFLNAAQVFEIGRALDQAALYFEQATDFASAARCYEASGDLARAAAALERAGRVDEAVERYQRLGPSDAFAECLARQQRYNDAAGMYRQVGNIRGEIEMLRLVPVTSPARVPAVLRLAELLEQYGHPDQAVGLLVDTVRTCEHARMHQPLYMTLARILEALGRVHEAAQVRGRIQNLLGAGAPEEAQVALAAAASAPAAVAPDAVLLAPEPAPAPVAVAAVPAGATPSDPFANLVDPFDASAKGEASGRDGYGHLKNIPIFAELALDDMRDLYRACDEVVYPAGGTIIEQGVHGQGLFVIVHGNVKVLRVDGGGATELASLGPGAYVGEISLVDDAPTSARVVTATEVRALFISRERFHQYLYGHEVAALRIYRLFTRTLAERLRQANVRR